MGILITNKNFHNSVIENFTIHHVPTNGHCEYIAIMEGLKQHTLHLSSPTSFRKLIHNHAQKFLIMLARITM